MRNILFVLALNLIFLVSNAQISTHELPVSFKYRIDKLKETPASSKKLPYLDFQKLDKEDQQDEKYGVPPRFGYRHKVDYSINNSGTWHTLPNGDKIWRLNISCPGALSINLLYSKFWLPENGKLFIYSSDKKHTIGAFTSVNNKGSKNNMQGFATGLVYSDKIILEYYQPKDIEEQAVISIDYVVHGYRYINLPDNKNLGSSGDCQVNVNCPEGNGWSNEKKAVALILVNGNRYCTGSLINTTANDLRPLFLTADHCLGGWANYHIKYDAVTNPNLNHYSFYWHYEHPTCSNSSTEPPIYSTVGATVVANNSISDFALLSLTENPLCEPNVSPYYLGWDRSGSSGSGGVGIHHPVGDVKKIATYTITPGTSNCFYSGNSNFWKVNWTSTSNGYSVTEGGSSGSPLINNNRKLIGQLYGFGPLCLNPNCSNPSEDIGNYGKFSTSWTGNGASDNRRRLDHWLDPAGTNPTTLNGRSIPFITGPDMVCYSPSQTFTLHNRPSGTTVNWTYNTSLLYPVSGQGTNNFTVRAKTSYVYGEGWVQANISKDGCDPISFRLEDFWVGRFQNTWLIGTPRVCPNTTYTYTAIVPFGNPSSYTYSWTYPSNWTKLSQYQNNIQLRTPSNPDYGTVRVSIENDCGWSDYSGITVYPGYCGGGGGYYSMSPNPADDYVEISIDESKMVENNIDEYEVRIYNSMNIMVSQIRTRKLTLRINTRQFINGVYYVHFIFNGKQQVEQLVISH